jgi:hypothetical protein
VVTGLLDDGPVGGAVDEPAGPPVDDGVEDFDSCDLGEGAAVEVGDGAGVGLPTAERRSVTARVPEAATTTAAMASARIRRGRRAVFADP